MRNITAFPTWKKNSDGFRGFRGNNSEEMQLEVFFTDYVYTDVHVYHVYHVYHVQDVHW